MASDNQRLTRERYVAKWDALDRRRGEDSFTEHFAGDAGDHLDAAIVRADLDTLSSAALPIARFVDRHVAHVDADPLDSLPTFAELNEAIDTIGELFKKYALLFTASGWVTLEPVPQNDWLAVFRVPWIRPSES
jgi:hypothetical protein